MKLDNFSTDSTEWSQISESVHPGASGTATIRSRQFGEAQLRLIVYSPHYLANHWCHKGHIVFVIAGQVTIEHENHLSYALGPGMSYCVGDDNESPHRIHSDSGATIFVVD